MIWLAIAALAVVALAPLGLTLRRAAALRGRRGAAMALYRAQLAELERDRAEGRIAPAEHAAAVLEVERRLLAAAETTERDAASAAGRSPVLAALVLVPLAAVALYWVGGSPQMPGAPLAERLAVARQEGALIDQLRARLAGLDPHSPRAREGYILLGNAENARGDMAAAADAWRHALAAGFDPTLAAMTAEALARSAGRVVPEAASLFRQALAQAPADAPWRKLAEQRLTEAQTE